MIMTLANGDTFTVTPSGLTLHNGKPVKLRGFAKTKTARSQNSNEIWLEDLDAAELQTAPIKRYPIFQEQGDAWRMFTFTSKVTSFSVELFEVTL
jgi:hypothetical protein